MNINEELVKELVQQQFPEYFNLLIKPVENMGHDNRTFFLGNQMTVRLPSGKDYALQAKKEQQWLPYFEQHVSLAVPKVIASGKPCEIFPYPWGIYKWLDGDIVSNIKDIDQTILATDLAMFLKQFHSIDCKDGPIAGQHNFYRGGQLSVYHQETITSIEHLDDTFNKELLLEIWKQALSSTWKHNPVWVHGDLFPSNMLVSNKRLSAIIDFGVLGVGDPSCDLAMYWTYFKGAARAVFKEKLNFDQDTWNRAQGWVLWKALITYDASDLKDSLVAIEARNCITLICNEYRVIK